MYFCENLRKMHSDLQQQIERVRAKTLVLSEKYMMMKASLEEARAQITELKAKVMSRDKTIQDLRAKAEYLSVASIIEHDVGSVEASRAIIADLLREVDRCIRDLVE